MLHVLPVRAGAVLKRLFDLVRDIERVAPGLLLDDQQQARAVVDDRVADRGGKALDDLGHVAEPERRPAAKADDGRRPGLRRSRMLVELPHGEPLIGRIDEPAAAERGRVGRGPFDVGQRSR